jgi:hypothetical protein
MAKVRYLKKDINFITGELVSECLTYQFFHKEVSVEKVSDIIGDIVDNRNDLFNRINNFGEKKNPRLVKKHFAEIRKDFEKSIALLDKLVE